jgi:hypothetical protein
VTDETYLGDGLYASFDGYQVRLRAPRGGDGNDHEVFLDDATLAAFEAWIAGLRRAAAQARDGARE